MSNKLWNFDSRSSDSPWIETIWRSQSQQAGDFLSIAVSRLEMVISRYAGQIHVSVRGPETQPTIAHCPPDGEWLGIATDPRCQPNADVVFSHDPTGRVRNSSRLAR